MPSAKKTRKVPSKARGSKKSSKKTKAKAKPSGNKFPPFTLPETIVEPENLLIRYEKDGSRTVFVRPNFAAVCCVYHPARMKEAMGGLIFRFIEMVRTGEEPDLAMFTAGAGAKIGRVEIRYEDEVIQEALAKYSQVAADYFTERLVRALSDFSELLILQVMSATVGAMKADGFLSFKEGSGLTEIWDSFNKAMARKVKRDWKAPKQGIAGVWNEEKRAEALEIYYSVKEPLTRAYPHQMTKEGEREWIRLIMEIGGYDKEGAEFRKNTTPGGLALGITGKRLGVTNEYSGKGEASLYYQLSVARAEKRAREKAQEIPRTSNDINDLFNMR